HDARGRVPAPAGLTPSPLLLRGAAAPAAFQELSDQLPYEAPEGDVPLLHDHHLADLPLEFLPHLRLQPDARDPHSALRIVVVPDSPPPSHTRPAAGPTGPSRGRAAFLQESGDPNRPGRPTGPNGVVGPGPGGGARGPVGSGRSTR